MSENAATSGQSGLSGSPDIPDSPLATRRRNPRARLERLLSAVRGVLAGIPRLLVLAWAAGRLLTLGLAVATALAGLVPVATAYMARLLIDTVATAIRLHAEHRPPRLTLALPLPGVTLHTPVLTAPIAIVTLVGAQFVVLVASSLVNSVIQI